MVFANVFTFFFGNESPVCQIFRICSLNNILQIFNRPFVTFAKWTGTWILSKVFKTWSYPTKTCPKNRPEPKIGPNQKSTKRKIGPNQKSARTENELNDNWPKPKIGQNRKLAETKNRPKSKIGLNWKLVQTQNWPKPKIGPYPKLAQTKNWPKPKIGPNQKSARTENRPESKIGPNQKSIKNRCQDAFHFRFH